MIDVSFVNVDDKWYSVKSSINRKTDGRYLLKIIHIYEAVERPRGASYLKKRTIYESADDGNFNMTAYKKIFDAIIKTVGKKYRMEHIII